MDYASFYRKSTYNMDGERVLCNRYESIGAGSLADLVVPDHLGYGYCAGDYSWLKETNENRKQRLKEERLEDEFNTIENLKRLADIRAGRIKINEPTQPWRKCPPFTRTELNDTNCGLATPTDAHRKAQSDLAARAERGEKKHCRSPYSKGHGAYTWKRGLAISIWDGIMGY